MNIDQFHSEDILFNWTFRSSSACSTKESFAFSFSITASGAPEINFLLLSFPENCCCSLFNFSISLLSLDIS